MRCGACWATPRSAPISYAVDTRAFRLSRGSVLRPAPTRSTRSWRDARRMSEHALAHRSEEAKVGSIDVSALAQRKVVLVHDWLTGMRGGERVLESLCRIFPDADLLTLVHVPGSVSPMIERRRVR